METPLQLRSLEDGVLMLGDLWDAKTSKRVGFNLFGNNLIREKPVETEERGEGEEGGQTKGKPKDVIITGASGDVRNYDFFHVKDSSTKAEGFKLGAEISCELLGGIVKISGGANFEAGFGNGMSTEELFQHLEYPTTTVKIFTVDPDKMKDFVEPHMKYLLGKKDDPIAKASDDVPPLTATHVVTEITIGGEMMGTVKITTKKKSDKYNLGFYVKGEANFVIASAAISANAKVGEEIVTTNYDLKIDLASMPPVAPPTDIKDFLKDGNVGEEFIKELKEQRHFKFWEKDKNPGGLWSVEEIEGLPMTFTLMPLSSVYKIPDAETLPNIEEGLLKDLQGCLETLSNWRGPDYYRREILKIFLWPQKILSDSTHKITEEVLGEEQNLFKVATEERQKILKAYVTFKEEFYEGDRRGEAVENFRKALEDANTVVKGLKDKEKNLLEDWTIRCTTELEHLRIDNTGPEPDDPQPDPPGPGQADPQETSPLVFFTNATELRSWFQSKRYAKLLYKTSTDEVVGGEVSISQRIYSLSRDLGRIYIQPGITYPTLSDKLAVRSNPDDSFFLTTPRGSLSFPKEDISKMGFVLDVLVSIAGASENTKYFRMGHLYKTFLELHGLRLQVKNSEDTVPLVELLLDNFQSDKMEIFHTLLDTQLAVENTLAEPKTFVFFTDAVQSARQGIHTLLQVKQERKEKVICGSIDLHIDENLPDSPPMFLAWENKLQAVCMDHLDFITVLYLLDNEPDIPEVPSIDFRREDYLCSNIRLKFAHLAFTRINSISKKEDLDDVEVKCQERLSNRDDGSKSFFQEILTNALGVAFDPDYFVNSFTRCAVYILGKTKNSAESGDPDLPQWKDDSGEFKVKVKEGDWNQISKKLGTFFEKHKEHQEEELRYFGGLNELYEGFQYFGGDIPIPMTETEEPKDPADPAYGDPEDYPASTENVLLPPEKQYENIEEVLKGFEGFMSDKFKAEIEDVREVGKVMKSKKTASLMYRDAVQEEMQRMTEDKTVPAITEKIKVVQLLKIMVDDIVANKMVTEDTVDDLVAFVANREVFPLIRNEEGEVVEKFPKEVLSRMKFDLGYRRYYHVLSDVVENTPENFSPFFGLSKFQLEMNRMKNFEDSMALIRLIQQTSPNQGTFLEFFKNIFPDEVVARKNMEDTLRIIWRYENFQRLVEKNAENEFVVRALAKAYVNVIDDVRRVPRYIPRNIAKIILSLDLSPEGNPVGFNPDWEDEKILLRSLQVMWVLQVVPENFQFYLLKNALKSGSPSKAALEKACANFFWNEDQKIYEGVWNLETVYKAIGKLLEAKISSKKRKIPRGKISGVTGTKADVGIVQKMKKKSKESSNLMTLGDFLELRMAPDTENLPANVEELSREVLYFLKTSRLSGGVPVLHPFLESIQKNRVDLLVQLLGRTDAPLSREILKILFAKFQGEFALPLIACNPLANPITFSCQVHSHFSLPSLPKVVTAIRIGQRQDSWGKSSFLNSFVSRNPRAFASKIDGEDVPEFLEGFAEALSIGDSEESSDQNISSEPFVLINLHGDALDFPDQLKFLEHVTSCFIVFWSPMTLTQIEEKRRLLLEKIRPSHSLVELFIDPEEDVLQEVPEDSIITTPFIAEDINNKSAAIRAVTSALSKRPRQPDTLTLAETTVPSLRFPQFHPTAEAFVAYVNGIGLQTLKTSLILQARVENPEPDELEEHWINHPHYSRLMTRFVEILNSTEFLAILIDVAELLAASQDTRDSHHALAWKKLRSMTVEEFDHESFTAQQEGSNPLKRQVLLGLLQNEVDVSGLSINDLLTEICKVVEILPSQVTLSDPIYLLMAEIVQTSHSISIPTVPRQGFFLDEWCKNFIHSFDSSSKFMVVSCLGSNSLENADLLDSLFGVNFISSRGRQSGSSWSETPWAGVHMRLLHFNEEVSTSSGLEGLLLINSRPVVSETTKHHPRLVQRDQKVAAFLMAVSNLTLCVNFDNISDVLLTSIVGLNRVNTEKTSKICQLFFVGMSTPPDKTEIAKEFESLWGFVESRVDYNDKSTLGNKVIKKTKDALEQEEEEEEDFVFNLTDDKSATFRLSDAILGYANTVPSSETSFLPEFLENFSPIWEEIVDHVDFPYPTIPETKDNEKFQINLFKLLDLIDDAFTFHTEIFPNMIFNDMTEIFNLWLKEAPGEVDVPMKKEMVLNKVTSRVNFILESCVLEDEKGPCAFCEDMEKALEQISGEWDVPTESTVKWEVFLKEVDTYVKWEKWHQINLGRQLIVSLEEKVLRNQPKTYKDGEADPYLPELQLSEVQKASLERRIVDAERRLKNEVVFVFGDVDMKWKEFEEEDEFSLLKNSPAYDNNECLEPEKLSELIEKLRNVINAVIMSKGFVGVYQSGMVRAVVSKVGELWKDLANGERRIINSFRFIVTSYAIWMLYKTATSAEKLWMKEYDPLEMVGPKKKTSSLRRKLP